MEPGNQTRTVYYETETNIRIIDNVPNADDYIQERGVLARAMGYETVTNKNRTLDIYDEGVLIGTYFHDKHMN